MNIKEKIKNFPDNPGIYLFYDSAGVLVYVGKATSLRSRVRSYFASQKSPRPIEGMIHEVVDIKYIKTDSVLEAIILEAVYIKKYLPKYNVLGKDDKSWNYIVVTKDVYPQIKIVRERELRNDEKEIRNQKLEINDSNLHKPLNSLTHKLQYTFGPYPGLNAREALKILRRLFYISTCEPGQKRPCLYYEMGQCLGVCTGEISAKDYLEKVIRPLILFLRGEKRRLIVNLKKEMAAAAREENFEEAGRIRNQIKSLERIQDIALLNKSFVENVHKTPHPTLSSERRGHLRIEGYDISNLGASDKVGSMVVFDETEPVKSAYRKFKIRTVVGQSDVDCLAEVLERRLKHQDWPLPNVFLIDGGLPQVNRAKQILRKNKIFTPIVGIAKGPKRKKNEFFVVAEKDSDFTQWFGQNVTLLIRVRDEAHRFAISFHRSQRKIV